MSTICKVCHEIKSGCCLYPENNEGTQIGLTFNEINKIVFSTGLSFNDFIEQDKVDHKIVEDLSQLVHPVFRKMFHDQIRFKLKVKDGMCVFLGNKGCLLPVSIRPHYCRLFPFWFQSDNYSLMILLSDTCIAQQRENNIKSLLNLFHTNQEELNRIFKILLSDAEDHVKELGNSFSKRVETELCFKPITKKQKYSIIEMVKTIWDGDDYIPLVFDKWVEDKKGLFIGAYFDNRLVGISKLSFYNKGYAWLEGLRADPNSPVRGIARGFNTYFLNYLKDCKNIKSIEFITYYANYPSIHSAEKFGFKKVASYSYKFLEIKKKPDLTNIETPVICQDVKSIIKLLKNSDFLQESRICSGWKAYPMSEFTIKKFFTNQSQCLAYLNEGKIKALILFEIDEDRKETHINFIFASNNNDLEALIKTVIYKSYQIGIKYFDVSIPNDHPYMKFFKMLRFKSFEHDRDYFLFRYEDYNSIN